MQAAGGAAVAGAGGAAPGATDILKNLLEEQQKKLVEVLATDDEKMITTKLLKKAGLREPGSNWTSANQDLVAEPLCWFFLVSKERGQATIAINAFLNSFPQRHLVQQVSALVLSLAAVCAVKEAQKINVFEAFTIIEPVLDTLHSSVGYLQAKKVAEAQRLTAREAGELLSMTRKDNTLCGRLEESARKIRSKRRRSHSRDSD